MEFRGGPSRGGGGGGGGKKTYKATDEEETEIAFELGLYTYANDDEKRFLPERYDEGAYLVIRNMILARWRADPSAYVSVEHACGFVMDKWKPLVHAAHRFLTSRGYINFGVGFATNYLTPGSAKGTCVVVGAGLAGLAAARQLMSFGHRVVVVEGRDRPGGRAWTTKLSGTDPKTGEVKTAVGEMGGRRVLSHTGPHTTAGNPLCVVARQLDVPFHDIRGTCPLYAEGGGARADAATDEKIEREYNEALAECTRKRLAFGSSDDEGIYRTRTAADLISLGGAIEEFRRERKPTPTREESDLFDWHLANLEFANAARLDVLSMGQWDQDDPYDFEGNHVFLRGGNGRIVSALARDVPVFYNHDVCSVSYPGEGGADDGEGVVVRCANGRSFGADVALVTVPLGVLKKEIIAFDPPLPERKLRAIANLGFGVLNKVILLFPEVFWDTTHDTFGYVRKCDGDSKKRGRYYMFYNYAGLSGGATLVALVAGDAALEMESGAFYTLDAVKGAMDVLRDIFTVGQNVPVPDPLDAACVRWGGDRHAFGSYSNISVGATGEDYDHLASTVGDRLFFAGEATNRMHPATMHGAFLSGVREAALI
ncbi:histone deacetylase, partial [Micromonas pusilla CCMP1545]